MIQHTPIEIIVQTDKYKVDNKLIESMNNNSWIVPVVDQDSFVAATTDENHNTSGARTLTV